MEIWLRQQTSAVLTALAHARVIYGGPTPPPPVNAFAPRPDLAAELGGELGV
jgi:hypothetical protein